MSTGSRSCPIPTAATKPISQSSRLVTADEQKPKADTLTIQPNEKKLPKYGGLDKSFQYAAFKLVNVVFNEQQDRLYTLVEALWASELKAYIVKSRGPEFHQFWFGVWTRYCKHATISADIQAVRSRNAVVEFLDEYDAISGRKPLKLLHQLDPTVARSMGNSHRQVARQLKLLSGAAQPSKQFEGTAKYMKEMGTTARDLRLGGMVTMVAVSWGEGSKWHHNTKDQSESPDPRPTQRGC